MAFTSLEARGLAKHGLFEEARHADLGHLDARGRIESRHGPITVNPGGVINGARLMRLNDDGTVVIRVDDTNIPEFWLELVLDPAKLTQWIAEEHATQ